MQLFAAFCFLLGGEADFCQVPCDPEITLKAAAGGFELLGQVVRGEVMGLVYEWDLQDSWPMHFAKAWLGVVG